MLNKITKPFKKRFNKVCEYFSPVKNAVTKLLDKSSGLFEKFKSLKESLNGLSDFQKLLLLTIAVVLPAGIFVAAALAKFFSRKK